MVDLSKLAFVAFPVILEIPEGRLEVYDRRCYNKGFAAYLYDNPQNCPRVGIGETPLVAVVDIFTERT